MPCYYPLTAWPSIHTNPSGKRSLVFKKNLGIVSQEVKVGCGQCIGCRLERSRQWAVRIMHEAQYHDSNSFLTLTYSDDHLPENSGLNKSHMQRFIKRLRKRLSPQTIRYYQCGEYGDKTRRPHHHMCLFGYDFSSDRKYLKMSGDYPLYYSDTLDQLWSHGNCYIGDLTFDSAAYVSRYCTKKVTGVAAHKPDDERFGLKHYEEVNFDTGEIFEIEPEYITCSLKPAIGYRHYVKYRENIYSHDEVYANGRLQKPPRYYDKRFEIDCPERMAAIKEDRKRLAELSEHSSPERLKAREEVKKAQLNNFVKKRL